MEPLVLPPSTSSRVCVHAAAMHGFSKWGAGDKGGRDTKTVISQPMETTKGIFFSIFKCL